MIMVVEAHSPDDLTQVRRSSPSGLLRRTVPSTPSAASATSAHRIPYAATSAAETPSKAAPDPPKAAQANLLTMQADEKDDPVLSAPTSHVPPIAPGPPGSETPGGVSTETPGLRDRSRPEGGDRLRPARDDTRGAVIADDDDS